MTAGRIMQGFGLVSLILGTVHLAADLQKENYSQAPAREIVQETKEKSCISNYRREICGAMIGAGGIVLMTFGRKEEQYSMPYR